MTYLLEYPLSVLLYVSITLLVVLLSRIAGRRGDARYLVAIVLILALLAALRGYSVGTDTSAYVNYYLTQNSTFFEVGYAALIHFFMLSGSVQLTLGGVAALTYGLVIWRFWTFREIFHFPVAVAAFVPMVFFASWNGQRFFMAVAILFFASKFLFDGKLLKYLALCGIAFLFHRTAICGLALLPLRLLWLGKLQGFAKAKTLATLPVALATGIAVVMVANGSGEFDRYFTTYESGEAGSIGGSWYVLGLIVLLAANYYIFSKRKGAGPGPEVTAVLLVAFIYFVVSIALYSIPAIGRLPQYFTPYICLALAWFWNVDVREQALLRLLIFVYISYLLLSLLGSNGHDVMPYTLWFFRGGLS